jgi:hypothetical protein
MAQAIEHLLCKLETLSSNPSPIQKQNLSIMENFKNYKKNTKNNLKTIIDPSLK